MSKIYNSNIEQETIANTNFRKVVATGLHSQVVLMSLNVGEDIGLETHEKVDQFFRIEKGEGKVVVDGEEIGVTDGSAVLVPAGSAHNVINTGSEALKLYTIYSPANHIDGRVHTTKADAMKDEEDEAFGHN
jgi:mannose-6-phosphate isomerase-like protein (cupin superfamily)